MSTIEFVFAHGDEVEDKVTGYKGIVIGLTSWLFGCKRITVQSQERKDHQPVSALVFDEGTLRLVRARVIEIDPVQVASNPGGPDEDVSRNPAPAEMSPR